MAEADGLQELVAAARGGCSDSFSRLVARTYRDTYAVALRLTGDADDAQDVAQDTYLRAFRSLRRFRGDSHISTWLYRITANCAASARRRRRRAAHEPLPPEAHIADPRPDHDPAQHADREEARTRVRAALAALPARQREVIVLRDIYDLTHEEIAARLSISESAAKVRLHRARRRLRDRLYADTETKADARQPCHAREPAPAKRLDKRLDKGPAKDAR